MASILKVVLVLVALAFVYYIKDVILIIIVSLILASAIDPWIDSLQKRRHWPRWLSILLIFVAALGIVTLTIILLVPAIANQIGQLTDNFPDVMDKLINSFNAAQQSEQGQSFLNSIQGALDNINNTLSTITSSIFSGVASFFGGIIMLIGVIFLTFYMTMEENGVEKFVKAVSPVQYQPYLMRLFRRIQERLGLWLRGQLILGMIIGALSFVGLILKKLGY